MKTILQVVFYKMVGSHSQPPHLTLQQMPSTLPGSINMAECSNDLAAQEGQHIRHKELQTNQFAPHHWSFIEKTSVMQDPNPKYFHMKCTDSYIPPHTKLLVTADQALPDLCLQ